MSRAVDQQQDERWMQRALELARYALQQGEVPVGAVLIRDGECWAEGWNQPISRQDPTAHAEIVALRAGAARQHNYRLPETTLYVTLEPCAMCAGALLQARVRRVVYGATDPRAGAAGSVFCVLGATGEQRLNHCPQLRAGVLSAPASLLLRDFFRQRR